MVPQIGVNGDTSQFNGLGGVYGVTDWASKWHCDTSQSNGLWGCMVPQTESQNGIVTPVSLMAYGGV